MQILRLQRIEKQRSATIMTKQELATKIWNTANELRKNIKASEYKDYILGFMFYKYLCDKELDYLHTLEGEEEDLKDADDATKNLFKDNVGYFIAYENLFSVWKKSGIMLGAKDVAEALDDFYLNLNDKHKTVFDKIFSALQTGLTKLGENSGSRDKAVRDIVDLVDLIPPTSRNYDVLGYIYEYLIQQFSSEAKKDGSFYTPHELTALMSRILAERLKDCDEVTVYDPTVGSGGLLLNIGHEVGKYVPAENIKYYGQELITETANLAKMNLFMQGVPVQNINMRNANTLEEDWPYFDEHTSYTPLFVDAVVSNPPYSAHYDPDARPNDERFRNYGNAPAGKADYAFLLHCLYHTRTGGVMAIVLPHGVLFRGDSEGEIRKNLILRHNIETIISMPESLFFATPIPVIVMILSKGRTKDDILFIDASQSYKKGKKQNVLTESDVQRIFDTVVARKEVPNYAHVATMEEIVANDYNLNVPRYVSATVQEAPYDLYSVMTGKVSTAELNAFQNIWDCFPQLHEKLMTTENGYNTFRDVDCKQIVLDDEDVKKFLADFKAVSSTFKHYLTDTLIDHSATSSVHSTVVEKLFKEFNGIPLVDVYRVFQALADNWTNIDADLARLEEEGWEICSQVEPNMVTRKDSKTKKTVEEQKGWKGKIIPFDLVKKAFFSDDFDKMNRLTADADTKASEYADIWENMDNDAKSVIAKDDDATAFDIKKFKAAIKNKDLSAEVISSIKAMETAISEEKTLRKQVKTIADVLDDKAKDKIMVLTEDEIHELLEMKWIHPIIAAIDNAGENVLSQFVSDMNALKKKYSDPMSDLTEQIEETSSSLKTALTQLTGNETDMEAIKLLMDEL